MDTEGGFYCKWWKNNIFTSTDKKTNFTALDHTRVTFFFGKCSYVPRRLMQNAVYFDKVYG